MISYDGRFFNNFFRRTWNLKTEKWINQLLFNLTLQESCNVDILVTSIIEERRDYLPLEELQVGRKDEHYVLNEIKRLTWTYLYIYIHTHAHTYVCVCVCAFYYKESTYEKYNYSKRTDWIKEIIIDSLKVNSKNASSFNFC